MDAMVWGGVRNQEEGLVATIAADSRHLGDVAPGGAVGQGVVVD